MEAGEWARVAALANPAAAARPVERVLGDSAAEILGESL